MLCIVLYCVAAVQQLPSRHGGVSLQLFSCAVCLRCCTMLQLCTQDKVDVVVFHCNGLVALVFIVLQCAVRKVKLAEADRGYEVVAMIHGATLLPTLRTQIHLFKALMHLRVQVGETIQNKYSSVFCIDSFISGVLNRFT